MAQFMGSPTLVSVLECGTDFVKLSWKPPGAAHNITQYEIQLKALSLPKSVFTGNKEPTYTIRELSPNTPYQIQVRAMYNNETRGTYSDWVKTTTQPLMITSSQKGETPGKPRVKSINLNCLTLEWDPLKEKVEYIMWYEVHYKTIRGDSWAACNTDNFEPNIDILDLDENSMYVAKVCAVLGNKTGPFSPESEPFGIKQMSSHFNDQSHPRDHKQSEQRETMQYSFPTNYPNSEFHQGSFVPSMPFPTGIGGNIPTHHHNSSSIAENPVDSPFDRSGPFCEPGKPREAIKPRNVSAIVQSQMLAIKWEYQTQDCRCCEISFKKNGKGRWQEEVTEEPTTSYDLEIDDDADSYKIRVRCMLKERAGPYSEVLEVQVNKKDDESGEEDQDVQSSTVDPHLNHQLAEKPGRPQVADCDITNESIRLTWKPPRKTNNITNYEISYKCQDESKSVCEVTDDTETSYTVYGLKPGNKYEFQAKAVFGYDRLGPKSESSRQVTTRLPGVPESTGGKHDTKLQGASAFEPGSGVLCDEQSIKPTDLRQPPQSPQQPELQDVTSSSIVLKWSDFNSAGVTHYEIEYHEEDDDTWKTTKTTRADCLITIDGLKPGSEYSFRVRGVNKLGVSDYSKESFPIQTKRTAAQRVLKQAKKLSSAQPAKYALKLTKGMKDKDKKIQQLDFGSPSQTHTSEKTIMVVGATGSGKSTLINGMVNYLLDVKWEDNFRYEMIQAENPGHNQAYSQTQFITTYKIYPMEGSQEKYTLNIVDTPGFGDTKGIARDKELVEQIRTLFGQPGQLSLQTVDAVCFVAPAAQARLTPTQRYIFDSVLAMFGKDIADNIVALLTFADGSDPPVLASLREAEVPFTGSFTFNNSALFESNVKTENIKSQKSFSKMFWDMGVQSFSRFFKELANMSPKSLTLSAEVLEERKHLEAKVEGLQVWITDGLSKVDTLRQERTILEQHDTDISANKDFKYTVREVVQIKIDLDQGEHVTNCLTCNRTCHYPCYIPKDQNKYNCAAMDYSNPNRETRSCTVCSGKCIWKVHVNNPYRFDCKTETKQKTYSELKKKYSDATGKRKDQLNIVAEVKKEIEGLQANIVEIIGDITNALRRLSEIALRPNPLTDVGYIDLLLASEEQEAKDGYEGRIKALKRVREQALLISKAQKSDLKFFNVD